MSAEIGLLALMRAAHGVTAAIWLGISFVGVLAPGALDGERFRGAWAPRIVARTSLWALVVSGAILVLDRLADPNVSLLYVALLGVKLGLVAAMGLLALASPAPAAQTPPHGRFGWITRVRQQRVLLALGLGAYVLGSLLTSAYEAVLRR